MYSQFRFANASIGVKKGIWSRVRSPGLGWICSLGYGGYFYGLRSIGMQVVEVAFVQYREVVEAASVQYIYREVATEIISLQCMCRPKKTKWYSNQQRLHSMLIEFR